MKTTKQPDTQQRKMGDLNTQKGNAGSGNSWGNTAETNKHDATGEAKRNTLNMETRLTK